MTAILTTGPDLMKTQREMRMEVPGVPAGWPVSPTVDPALRHRVLVVDDHRLLVQLLVGALASEEDMECVGTAHDIESALALTDALQPDVVMMDVRLADGDGIAATRELTTRFPELRVVVVTAFVDARLMQRAAEAGACALLAKDGELQNLLHTVRTAVRGGFVVQSELVDMSAHEGPGPGYRRPQLTDRDRAVLRMLAAGCDSTAIARELNVSPEAGRGCVAHVLSAVGAPSPLEAVVVAMRNGLFHRGPTE